MNSGAVEVFDGELEAVDVIEVTVPFRQQPICLFIKGAGPTFFAAVFVLTLHLWIGWRLVDATSLPARWTSLAWFALGALYVSMPLALVSQRLRPLWFARAAHWMGFLWFGGFALTVVTLGLGELIAHFAMRAMPHVDPLWIAQVKAMSVVSAVVAALILGLVTARGRARVEELEVEVDDLSPEFDGLRIVQISDMHVGPTLRHRFVTRVVEQVNALNPDVVAITGDLIDAPIPDVREDLAPLAQLRATIGSFYVTGNHEYYHGVSACEAEVRKLGVTPLLNEHRVLRRGDASLTLGGVTDHEAGHSRPDHACSPERAFANAPPARLSPRILLAHQPRTARLTAGLNVALQLSGHTHGGQLFPFQKLVRLQQPSVAGLRQVKGTRVYTHRGTGYWGPPLRLGPTPEIAVITLRAAR